MKINNKNKKKKMIIATVIVLLLVGGGTAWAKITQVGPFSEKGTIDKKPPSSEQKKNQKTIKKESIEANSGEQTNKPSQEDGASQSSTNSGSIGIMITSVNQDNNNLVISTLIQAVSSDGSCAITLTRNGSKTYNQTVGVQPMASSSTCKGFTVPKNQLTSGAWSIDLQYKSSKGSGNTKRTVEVQ